MHSKPLIIASLFFASVNLAAQKKPVITKPVTQLPVVKLLSQNDSIQYAIGAYLAQWVNTNGFPINNPSLFLQGMDDIFRNQPRLIADSLVGKIVANYQEIIKRERVRKSEDQLFTSLKDKPGIGILPNGLYYFILTNGEGVHPARSDSVIMHIKGTTADGTSFEDTYLKKQPVMTMVADMIPGIAAVLPMMGAGSKWQLYIPSGLAYGDKAAGIIPANSALIVDLELVEVRHVRK